MRVRVFRSLWHGDLVLEIGRLRLWALRGFWPRWPYLRVQYGCVLFGMGYLAGMWFLARLTVSERANWAQPGRKA